jgi:hypothetical protein
MDPKLARFIAEDKIRTKESFFSNHEIFVISFSRKPIELIGLTKLQKVNVGFEDIVIQIERSWKQVVKRIDFFKDYLPIADRSVFPPRPLIHNIGLRDFFWYLIFATNEDSRAERITLRLAVKERLAELFRLHGLPCNILSGPSHRYQIFRHFEEQGMWASGNDRSAYFPASKQKLEPASIFPPMTVAEFLTYHGTQAERICNDMFAYIDYSRSEKKRDYKYFREEHIPIYAFLRHFNVDQNAVLYLGGEKESWDARVVGPDDSEKIIEITQAVARDTHLFRQESTRNLVLPLEARTQHQRVIDSFPTPIINAIAKKHEKKYAERRTLLVSVMGEYTHEDDFVIEEWIRTVRLASHVGNFNNIYLVELARRKLFQIF